MSDDSSKPTQDNKSKREPIHDDNRREFIRGSSLLLAAALPTAGLRSASTSPTIRVGLVGCGSTGIALASEALRSEFADVRLVAMADMFGDRVQQAIRALKGRFASQFTVDKRRLIGLDGCERLAQLDLDLVIIASPPGFRAKQLEAVVGVGKHAYVNQCVAIHQAGLERVQQLGQVADANRTCLTVGHARLDSPKMSQALNAIHAGELGRPVELRAVARASKGGRERSAAAGSEHSDFDSQVRNWRQVPKIAGHPILSQQIRLVEVANALFGGGPEGVGYAVSASVASGCLHEDAPVTTYRYSDGRRLQIQCQADIARPSWSTLEVVCEGGRVDLLSAGILPSGSHDAWRTPRTTPWEPHANERQLSRMALTIQAIASGQCRSDVNVAANALSAVLSCGHAAAESLNSASA